MLLKKHVLAVFILGVVVMSGFAPVLGTTSDISSNAVAPLVVQFGDSVEELTAIAELKSNFPHAKIVDFSAYERIVSFRGSVIYVGHSSDAGMQYNEKTVPWDVLAHMIRISKSNSHYVLGCESSRIEQLTKSTGKYVFGFGQIVDAIFGANIISILIASAFSAGTQIVNFVGKALLRVFLDTSDSSFLPMTTYIIDNLGIQEGMLRIGNFLLLALAVLLPSFSLVAGFGEIKSALTGWFLIGRGMTLMYTFRNFLNALTTGAPITDLALNLLNFVINLLTFIDYFIHTFLPWWRAIGAVGAVANDAATTGVRMTTVVIGLLVSTVYLINEYLKFEIDRKDSGDVPTW